MSQSAFPAAAPRRRWLLFLPFAIIVLLAAAWTGVWFYAAARAEAEIAVWRERERQAGRAQDCASQSIGGYPFRIEVRCGGASFELKGTPTLQLKLPLAVVAVQVYDPKLLIGEFTGPLEISEPGGPPAGIVNWTSAQASVRGPPAGVERASLALVEPTVRDPSIVANDAVFRARRLELHGRPAAGSTADNPLVETALRLEAAVADKLHPLAAKPIDADIAAILRGVNDVSPKPWPARFREWQARDGQIEITKARLAQEDVIAVGTGVLKLTSRGVRRSQGDRRRHRKSPQDVRHRTHHVGRADRGNVQRARSIDARARRDRAPKRGSRLGRGARPAHRTRGQAGGDVSGALCGRRGFPRAVSGGHGVAAVLSAGTAQASKAFVYKSRRTRFSRSASRRGMNNGGSHADRHVDSSIP